MCLNKRYIAWLAVFFFLFHTSAAFAFTSFAVTIVPIRDEITIDQYALFNLTVYNNQDFEDSFRIYYTDVEWDVVTDPLSDSTLTIPADGKKSTLLKAAPLLISTGKQGITINVKSTRTARIKRPKFFVDISSLGTWEPGRPISVKTIIDAPKVIDPRLSAKISIEMRNRYAVNITDMDVIVESSLFRESRTVSIGPLESKTISFVIDLPDDTKPLDDQLSILLVSKGQTFKEIERSYRVKAFSKLVERPRDTVKKFLKTERLLEVYNDGNMENSGSVKVPVSFIERLFTFTSPKASTIVEDGQRYLVWNIRLAPGGSADIIIARSYRFFALVILLAITGILLYFNYRTPIVAMKQPVDTRMKEGGISEIKLVLVVKNRTKRVLSDVKVMEHIPNITELVKTFKIGTLKPVKIMTHESKGTIVTWEIPELEGFEERVISYTIRSKLSILGSFRLPPTVIKFMQGNAHKKSYSNAALLRAGMEKAVEE